MYKSMRELKITSALKRVASREDGFCVLEASQKYTEGEEKVIRWEYLVGRFRDRETEYYALPRHNHHHQRLTRYGVRHRLGVLTEALSSKGRIPLVGSSPVDNAREIPILTNLADVYFERKPHFGYEYRLKAYVSYPLGLARTRDVPIIWAFLGVVSLAFFLTIAAWAAWQAVFLTSALTAAPPFPSSELVYTHHHAQYVASLSFHAFVAVLGVVVVLLEAGPKIWPRIGRIHYVVDQQIAGWFYGLIHGLIPLALLGIYLGSFLSPMYEVFIDRPNEQVIRRDTHLQPPGVRHETIQFAEIDEVRGEIVTHSHEKEDGPDLIEFHSVIRVVTADGRVMEVGRDFPAQSSRRYAPDARLLAVTIAEKANADLDLK